MTFFAALLRAVNVGGTGALPMSDLRAMCEATGFRRVRTHLASGNAVFETGDDEAQVKAALERALQARAGKPVGVMVRTGAEMAKVLAANPFAAAPPNLTVTIFLDHPPPRDALDHVTGRGKEEMALGAREIYVFYPDGQGASKLKISAAKAGTARNINTVAALARLAGNLSP
jgi:uncharacterized protein (DUF1697 family)